MKFTKSEDAVSPVIGVILMVAITVILAAVIGAFVFNIAGSTSSSKTVAITASQNANGYVTFTIQGGPDLNAVTTLNATVNGTANNGSLTAPVSVGQTFNTTTPATSGSRVMVIGKFSDGSTQILFDKTY